MENEDNNVWRELIESIIDKKVIPVIGPGLLSLKNGDNLYNVMANRLLETYQPKNIDNDLCQNLNNVVLSISRAVKRPDRIKGKFSELYEACRFDVPEPIRKLASIDSFRLFINTTWDITLQKAIKNQRGPLKTESYTFSGSQQFDDIEPYEAIVTANKTVCINIFGKINKYSDFVLTDEDLLEAIVRFYNAKQENLFNLFDSMRDNELLFLGCNFPDWLGKFFIRAITNTRFNDPKQPQKYISDQIDLKNRNYTYFIHNYKGHIFNIGPERFIDKLYEELTGRTGYISPINKHVFISYANQDSEMAKKIRDSLEKLSPGSVWFDENQLASGDYYDNIIKENIKFCSVFIPILSKHTTSDYLTSNQYYKKEWDWAKIGRYDLIEQIGEETSSFIHPVLIDHEVNLSGLSWLADAFGPVSIQRCFDDDAISLFARRIKAVCFPDQA